VLRVSLAITAAASELEAYKKNQKTAIRKILLEGASRLHALRMLD
jgi:hypothetical protein